MFLPKNVVSVKILDPLTGRDATLPPFSKGRTDFTSSTAKWQQHVALSLFHGFSAVSS